MNNGIIIAFLMLFVFILLGWTLSLITSLIFSPSIHTPKSVLKEILAIMNISDGDVIFDLGSGDGRVLIAARKYKKVKGFGYDISPLIVSLSKIVRLVNLGINHDTIFDVENIFDVSLKKAEKIYVYQNPKLLTILNKKFKKELNNIFVYSYKYQIPDKKFEREFELSNKEKIYEYKY